MTMPAPCRVLCWCLLAGSLGCKAFERRPHADPVRAGCPAQVSPCAQPSDTGNYIGYQVGGGAPICGSGPCASDSTWGWDYEGHLLPSNVALGWWYGQKDQGGTGAYKTDGPR